LGGGISDLATGLETFAKIDSAALTNNVAQLEKMSGKGFFESIGEGVKDAGSYVAEKTGQLKEAVVSTAKSAMESDTAKSLKTKAVETRKTVEGMVKKEPEAEVGSTKGKIRRVSSVSSDFGDFGGGQSFDTSPKASLADLKLLGYSDAQIKEGVTLTGQMRMEAAQIRKSKLATGGLITPKTAGIFQLHQGEMVLDNAAVAAFTKSLNLVNMSQANELASVGGGGAPVIINNNNVDNSMQSSQTTAVSIPAPTRSNESTLRALQNS